MNDAELFYSAVEAGMSTLRTALEGQDASKIEKAQQSLRAAFMVLVNAVDDIDNPLFTDIERRVKAIGEEAAARAAQSMPTVSDEDAVKREPPKAKKQTPVDRIFTANRDSGMRDGPNKELIDQALAAGMSPEDIQYRTAYDIQLFLGKRRRDGTFPSGEIDPQVGLGEELKCLTIDLEKYVDLKIALTAEGKSKESVRDVRQSIRKLWTEMMFQENDRVIVRVHHYNLRSGNLQDHRFGRIDEDYSEMYGRLLEINVPPVSIQLETKEEAPLRNARGANKNYTVRNPTPDELRLLDSAEEKKRKDAIKDAILLILGKEGLIKK